MLIPWERYQSLLARENHQEEIKQEECSAPASHSQIEGAESCNTQSSVDNSTCHSTGGVAVQESNRTPEVETSGENKKAIPMQDQSGGGSFNISENRLTEKEFMSLRPPGVIARKWMSWN